jgi:hypothetical protein
VLAFCEGRKNSRSDTGDIDLLVKRSTDQGKTWSRPAGNALPNPNSTFATVTIDGQVGMRAAGGEGCGFMHRRVAGWVAAVATVRRAPLLAVLRLPG